MTKKTIIRKPVISLDAPNELLERVTESIEPSLISENPEVSIRVFEHNPKPYVRRKPHAFQTINQIENEIQYERYGELKRTIVLDDLNYDIHTSLPVDEEGVLLCVRDAIQKKNKKRVVHGELLKYNGKGLLVVGPERSGKTSLSLRLMNEFPMTFIGDEMISLEGTTEELTGQYVPHTVFVRVHDLMQCHLDQYLSDIRLTNASQYMDQGRVDRILAQELYTIDAGLVFSRKEFCSALGISSAPLSSIDYIIQTEYQQVPFVVEQNMSLDEELLSDHGAHMGFPYSQFEKDKQSYSLLKATKVAFENAWAIPYKELSQLLDTSE